jgi:hypothetical protein
MYWIEEEKNVVVDPRLGMFVVIDMMESEAA